MTQHRSHGTVLSSNIGNKGFGFIRPDGHNSSRDVFFHDTECKSGSVGVHERVSYIETAGDKGTGLKALDVRLEGDEVHRTEAPVDRTEKRNTRYDQD